MSRNNVLCEGFSSISNISISAYITVGIVPYLWRRVRAYAGRGYSQKRHRFLAGGVLQIWE